jgi:hypothetical protein
MVPPLPLVWPLALSERKLHRPSLKLVILSEAKNLLFSRVVHPRRRQSSARWECHRRGRQGLIGNRPSL